MLHAFNREASRVQLYYTRRTTLCTGAHAREMFAGAALLAAFWKNPGRSGRGGASRAFAGWLQQCDCVFASGQSRYPEWEYHLEGSVRNSDPAIFALASGLEALNAGRYFVDHRDTDRMLDTLCKTLRLRGISCAATD